MEKCSLPTDPRKCTSSRCFLDLTLNSHFQEKFQLILLLFKKKILKKKKIVSQNYTLNFRSKRAIHKVDALSFA